MHSSCYLRPLLLLRLPVMWHFCTCLLDPIKITTPTQQDELACSAYLEYDDYSNAKSALDAAQQVRLKPLQRMKQGIVLITKTPQVLSN